MTHTTTLARTPMAFLCSRARKSVGTQRSKSQDSPRKLPTRLSPDWLSFMHALRRPAQRAAIALVARPPPSAAAPRYQRLLSDVALPPARPWFVDPEPVNSRELPPHLLPKSHDLPPDLPVPVKELFHTLSKSPFLESSTLEVKEPSAIPPGPPLPKTIPKGRRGRGRTYSGEGIPDDQGGIWNWIVTAQVMSLLKYPVFCYR